MKDFEGPIPVEVIRGGEKIAKGKEKAAIFLIGPQFDNEAQGS
jgi:hypothetical protein